jgi:hypothetical protein
MEYWSVGVLDRIDKEPLAKRIESVVCAHHSHRSIVSPLHYSISPPLQLSISPKLTP